MPVSFENFEYSFRNDKGKPVFVPSKRGRKVAAEIMELVSEKIDFEPYYYHFSKGAHVAALHSHRQHRFFARIDLKNFFYSVARNRVKSVLKELSVPRAEHYAKWSTVRNPYDDPRYALPYGFPQSPLLATATLRKSALGAAIHGLPESIRRSVYLDDIAISSDERGDLSQAFDELSAAVIRANFQLNVAKLRAPEERIDLFNCDLSHGRSVVADDRIAEFHEHATSAKSIAAFESYMASVSAGNND